MPDHDYPTPANAFHPEFLHQLDQHDDPVTADEAVTGGFWRVVPLDDERFGLFRVWENPEDGDEPFATLSDREREVMLRVIEGKLNKVIADELEISVKTVEFHRARVMEKMGVGSVAALVQLRMQYPE